MGNLQMNNQQETTKLTEIREWLWELAIQKTCQDWEEWKHILQIDYSNLAEYEEARTIHNYLEFLQRYLSDWGWEKKRRLELEKDNNHAH